MSRLHDELHGTRIFFTHNRHEARSLFPVDDLPSGEDAADKFIEAKIPA